VSLPVGLRGQLVSVLAALVVCCQPRSTVLVSIGDIEIGEGDLRSFEASLPQHLKSSQTGEARVRDLLQSMVDRELMVLEATGRGYDRLLSVQTELNRRRTTWLTDRLIGQAGDELIVTEAEARSLYDEYDLGSQLQVAEILLEDPVAAQRVIDALKAGADFGDLARDLSISPTAAAGGTWPQYVSYPDLALELRAPLSGLSPGEFTESAIQMSGQSAVYKVVDKRHTQFEVLATRIENMLGRQKLSRERRRLVEEWGNRMGRSVDPSGVTLLLATVSDGVSLSSTGLASFEGWELTVGEAMGILTAGSAPVPGDSSLVAAAVHRIVDDSLLVYAATRLGLASSSELLTLLAEKRRELLVRELWRQEARNKVEVSDRDVRRIYEDSLHVYHHDGNVEVVEVLVDRLEEAEALLAEAIEGAPLASLASLHTQRPGGRSSNGRFHIHSTDASLKQLYRAAERAETGELVGPVETDAGFSVFRVTGREIAGPRPLEAVAPAIRLSVRRVREKALIDRFLSELRGVRAADVIWHDDTIARFSSH
jgi:peptidyl-prolyl cis-trans isomerase C